MIFPFYLFIFFLGAIVGSFVGVVVDRLSSKESIWKGRSHCDHCRHRLHWNDLIPVVSFLMLNRKCRYCGKQLTWYFFMIEVLTGLAFVITGYAIFQDSWFMIANLHYILVALYYFSLIGALMAIFFADLRFGIIPFKIVGFALAVCLIWFLMLPSLYFSPLEVSMLGFQTDFLNSLGAAFGASLFFFILFLVTRGRGMGFGDVVYAFLMGFILGFPKVILALYLAFVTGAVVAIILIVGHKKKFKGGTIPFGPFLVFGTIVSLLWGNFLINYIMQFFML
jgi:leader peptidase (prepilin peptidase) / N-methyltransferase